MFRLRSSDLCFNLTKDKQNLSKYLLFRFIRMTTIGHNFGSQAHRGGGPVDHTVDPIIKVTDKLWRALVRAYAENPDR